MDNGIVDKEDEQIQSLAKEINKNRKKMFLWR